MISTEPTAAIMPPIRQLIFCGFTLEKSNAGETKLATMLMPTVAIMKVSAPRMTAYTLSSWATVCTGSMISSPNTGRVAAAVTTTSSEKTRKFTGRPRKLPFLTAAKLLP